MNPRIQELWRQAVLNNTKTPMNFQDAADEFAELIVRECITHIEKDRFRKADLLDTEYDDGYVDGMGRAERILKEHFGVEE